ncbi:hypothetical protein B2J88_11895 [Rhodococcus sp. SRB_17]|uniref:hypothetical protein n=1 Tax=Acidovorax sp. SRB_24 TaxID=1962700 RepID=UPI00145E18CE|nr:hypothetical protein [Acidovorax sp. SRB_24]NMM75543.1 hypothetical protein [Acidovorax sp. SRB_24]NMM85062.1 hypothetical protein [Rhodococcus sp. SRB_17]
MSILYSIKQSFNGFVLAALAMSCASPAMAQNKGAAPMQFATPEAMAEEMGDFSPETGAFKVLKRKPLHIRLAINGDGLTRDPQYLAEDFLRAFQWGVWRTFLHTKADQVTVTVVSPTPVDGHTTMTATVTRAKALQVAQSLLGVREFADLVTPHQTWTDAMKRCRYSDSGQPGLRACTLALAGKT